MSMLSKHVKAVGVCLALAFPLAACGLNPTTVSTASTEAAALVQDLLAAEQQVQAACKDVTLQSSPACATTALNDLQALIAKVQTDLSGLGVSGGNTTVATIEADIADAIGLIAQYAPTLLQLVGIVGALDQMPHAAIVHDDTTQSLAKHWNAFRAVAH